MDGDEAPTQVQAVRLGGHGVNDHITTVRIDLRRCTLIRAARCVDHNFASNAIYSVYVHHPEFGSAKIVVLVYRGPRSESFYLVDQLHSVAAFRMLCEEIPEGHLWTILSALIEGGAYESAAPESIEELIEIARRANCPAEI